MKKNCLIFGGGGFIGSHLCEELLKQGHNVTVFDKINFSKKNISDFIDKVKVIEGDFNNIVDIRKSLDDIDCVYHFVSSTLPANSNENPVYDAETNLISTLKLLRECVSEKIKKVIFLSSGGTVYGIPEKIPVKENYNSNPICSYGIIKRTIEEYLFMFEKIYGLDYFVFRLSNPYGEKQNPEAAQGVIPVFINKVLNNEKIIVWGNGEVIRDYIYIKDAVKALAKAAVVDSEKKVFNLSTGKGSSINEIIELIREVTGRIIKVERKEGRLIDVPVSILDNTLIKKIFKWKPETSIKDGIAITYNYLRKANAR